MLERSAGNASGRLAAVNMADLPPRRHGFLTLLLRALAFCGALHRTSMRFLSLHGGLVGSPHMLGEFVPGVGVPVRYRLQQLSPPGRDVEADFANPTDRVRITLATRGLAIGHSLLPVGYGCPP